VPESPGQPEMSSSEPRHTVPRRLLLVDGDVNARRGLTLLIGDEPDMVVAGEAGSLKEALDAISHERPDVVIVDVVFSDGDAFELVRRMRKVQPSVRVLVLAARHEGVCAERLLRAGALGYVMKSAPVDEIRRALRRVVAGEMHISAALGAEFQRRFVWPDAAVTKTLGCALEILSTREFQIFQLLGNGKSPVQIAAVLSVSPKTIETHRQHVRDKLSLTSPVQFARCAYECATHCRLECAAKATCELDPRYRSRPQSPSPSLFY